MSPEQLGPHRFSSSPTRYNIYTISAHAWTLKDFFASLMDRGANGGIIGRDARPFRRYRRRVTITGIDDHKLKGLPICDAAAKIVTHRGPVIAIFCQYAYSGKGRTIHSVGQIEAYQNTVFDRSIKVGGKQCMVTLDGYVVPLDFHWGLPYLQMSPHTDEEWETLPHVVITGPGEWDPTSLDYYITTQEDWFERVKELDEGLLDSNFDEYGNYKDRVNPRLPATPSEPNMDIDDEGSEASWEACVAELHASPDWDLHQCFHIASDLEYARYAFDLETVTTADSTDQGSATSHDEDSTLSDSSDDTDDLIQASPKRTKTTKIDYQKYRPFFLFAPVATIKKTFENTTQYASNVLSGRHIQKTIKSPYPAFNVYRRFEPVATDTVFAETPSIDGGCTCAQIFVGRKSRVIDVYGMKTVKEFVDTLEDVIRKRGAMDKLISDAAKVEMSRRVMDVLCALLVENWSAERGYQHQNYAEIIWKYLKRNVQWFMNWRDVPANLWLLCLKWCADVTNHTAVESLKWRTPLEVLTGQTSDISILLCFLFYDVVYVARYKETSKQKDQETGEEFKAFQDQLGSRKSDEIRGRFVGFSWDVGHALTFLILNEETGKIIGRSQVRLANVFENNLKADANANAVSDRVYLSSNWDESKPLPTVDISTTPFSTADIGPDDHLSDDEGESTKGEPKHRTLLPPVETPTKDVPASTRIEQDPLQPVVETVDDDSDSEDEDDPPPPLRRKSSGESTPAPHVANSVPSPPNSGNERHPKALDEKHPNAFDDYATKKGSKGPEPKPLPTVDEQPRGRRPGKPVPRSRYGSPRSSPKPRRPPRPMTAPTRIMPSRSAKQRLQAKMAQRQAKQEADAKSKDWLKMTLKQIAEMKETHPDMTLEEFVALNEGESNARPGPDPLEMDHPSPMDATPLKESPVLDEFEKEDNLPPHLKDEAKTPEGVMDFGSEPMVPANPVITGLPPEQLIDRTFLMPPAQDGTRVRAKIIRRLEEANNKRLHDLQDNEDYIKFVCLVNGEREEVVAYNQIVDHIEADQTFDGIWKYKEILDHKKVKPSDEDYRGSKYNLLIEWETGERTWEPLTTVDKKGIYDLDRVTVAIYARQNKLLDEPGWRLPGMRKLAKTQKRLLRLANQAKLSSYRNTMKYMYGVRVPVR